MEAILNNEVHDDGNGNDNDNDDDDNDAVLEQTKDSRRRRRI